MAVLTPAAALSLALQCPGLPPALAPVMVGIAQHESGLRTDAVNRNQNGTVDVGISQINSANFGWLGLTFETALNPCVNLVAGARVLLAKYNGDPPIAGKIAYASDVMARISAAAMKVQAAQGGPPDSPGASMADQNDTSVFTRPGSGRELVFSSTSNKRN